MVAPRVASVCVDLWLRPELQVCVYVCVHGVDVMYTLCMGMRGKSSSVCKTGEGGEERTLPELTLRRYTQHKFFL
jgi:hypothetical protein